MIIRMDKILYYSSGDEAAMFSWLKDIKGVKKVVGRGTIIYITVVSTPSTRTVLELAGLFKRYRADMKELKVFSPILKKINKKYTETPYWYKEIMD